MRYTVSNDNRSGMTQSRRVTRFLRLLPVLAAVLCLLALMPAGASEAEDRPTETGTAQQEKTEEDTQQAEAKTKSKWELLMDKYREKSNTNRLIFVKYNGGTSCTVRLYKKVAKKNGKHKWKKILVCKGYVGRNGIGKTRE